jgi:hypothetical protein
VTKARIGVYKGACTVNFFARIAARKSGDFMAKAKKRQRQAGPKNKTSKRKRKRNISPQTNQPFEQDFKRRIGPYGGAGEPPIMQ